MRRVLKGIHALVIQNIYYLCLYHKIHFGIRELRLILLMFTQLSHSFNNCNTNIMRLIHKVSMYLNKTFTKQLFVNQ